MSYNDPYGNPQGYGQSGQPYMGQPPQYSPPDSFAIPLVPGNPYFRQNGTAGGAALAWDV